MGLVGAAAEFRVELAGHIPRVLFNGKLQHFHHALVRGLAAQHQPIRLEIRQVGVVDLVAVAVAFIN